MAGCATNRCVEEALRQAEDRAARLRFLADSAAAAKTGIVPESPVFSGISESGR
jgi:nicotinamidase-related amidase